MTAEFMDHILSEPDLQVAIGELLLANPVMTASGTFGYGQEFASLLDLNQLGAIVVKGLSLAPTVGNPPPRIVETASGMLNAIGLENLGVEAFIQSKLPFLERLKPPLIVNIYGQYVSQYAELAGRLAPCRKVAALEVNISCPNVKTGGLAFGVNAKAAFEVVRAVKAEARQPVWVKLSPNVTDIREIASAVVEAGADALSLINTLTGMAVDCHTRRPRLANITGGLSGPAIKPVALRMVWEVARTVEVPVIGIGGIMTAEDALEFLIVGARAVQVGTANFINPRATIDIIEGIRSYLQQHGIGRVTEVVGTLRLEG